MNACLTSIPVHRHAIYEVGDLPENDRLRYTIHPDARKELLKRPLQLNHKLYAEEERRPAQENAGEEEHRGCWRSKPTHTRNRIEEKAMSGVRLHNMRAGDRNTRASAP